MNRVDPKQVTVAGDATRQEIFAVEKRRHKALMAADTAALSELLDETLVHIHAPGLTHSKPQLLEHVEKRQAYIEMRRENLRIRMIGGDVAIMTGRLINRLRSPDGGERVIAGMATQVLRRRENGAWQFVSFQMTPDGEHIWPALASELVTDDEGDTIDTRANSGEETP
ncbi:YybH family protein [Nocardia vaccinii]|uniref:YybH family protein n=1 Tax=Nocardia vaccinii TaxID=1822 RepID=UPI00082AF89A|nr:nuclear transport factor 2 family protein [Nocardia vaccinii]